jgi:hypothetical protein
LALVIVFFFFIGFPIVKGIIHRWKKCKQCL